MTDSLKDEVREQLRSILTEVAQGGAKVLADPDVFDCAVKGGEIEIANLVLGVNELEWGSIGEEVWFSQNGLGGTYQIEFDEQRQKYWAMFNTAGETLTVGVADTLETAKAACQRDYAKRIQSALTSKPAPVVSDDLGIRALTDLSVQRAMRWHSGGLSEWSLSDWAVALSGEVGELCDVIKKLNRHRDGTPGNTKPYEELLKDFADEAHDVLAYLVLLCAAQKVDLVDASVSKFNAVSERMGFPEQLTANTEADIRADERERLCEALTPSCETKAAFMGEFSFLIDELDEDGEERPRKITVPWDTIKEIMAAIRAHSQGEG